MVFNPTGESTSLSAPIGGLNTRDAVDLMPQTDAIRLDNFFPGSTDVSLRKGFTNHVTGFSAAVHSLLTYHSPTANKLFAVIAVESNNTSVLFSPFSLLDTTSAFRGIT